MHGSFVGRLSRSENLRFIRMTSVWGRRPEIALRGVGGLRAAIGMAEAMPFHESPEPLLSTLGRRTRGVRHRTKAGSSTTRVLRERKITLRSE